MADLRIRACVWVLIAATAGAACNQSPATPSPSPTPTPQTAVTFASRLAVGGFAWRSFTVDNTGTVTVRLALLNPETAAAVGLGIGTFDGTTCTVTNSVQTAPNDTDPQISTTLASGNFCVRIWDIGQLTKTNDFQVAVILP